MVDSGGGGGSQFGKAKKMSCSFIYPDTPWVGSSHVRPFVKVFLSSTTDSSSTSTVPLPGSDPPYSGGGWNGDGSRGHHLHHHHHHYNHSGEGGGSEDGGEGESWDLTQSRSSAQSGTDRQLSLKLRELDLHGTKRPPSRNNGSGNNSTNTGRKVAGFDKVSFDREELRPLAGSGLGPGKQPPIRANGLKTSLLRADHFLPPRTSGGRDEDLVAMGTIWNPSHQQQQQARVSGTAASLVKATSAPTSTSTIPGGGGNVGGINGVGGLLGRRPVNLGTSMSTRQLLQSSGTGSSGGGGGASFGGNSGSKVVKEVEPKYSDPLSGACPTFQQRLMELAALEAETVRWEKTKKMKKKPKQDRDS